MSFLRRLFGSGSDPDRSRDIDSELERLEAEAEQAGPAYVGSAFNRAGDLALRSGKPDRAVACYGRAIDAFLLDAQQEAARGVANKIVRVRPAAVRTLCTLTWLDLAARHHATALLHLRDYVDAARGADQQARAATQIYAMARLSPHAEFVHAVADALDGLDYPSRASEVRGWTEAGSPDVIEEPDALAEACLHAAVRASGPEGELLQDVPGSRGDRSSADPQGA
jgi:hypothetical protein